MTRIVEIAEVRKNQFTVLFSCDNCDLLVTERKSHFDRKNRHFCSRQCYSEFRRDKLPIEEHARYGSGHSPEEKQRRIKARADLNHYLRDKKIPRGRCEKCGEKAEAHHHDYDKPLEVRWLCFKHHREEHKLIYENPELVNGLNEDTN